MKRTFEIIKNVVVILITVAALSMMVFTVVSVLTLNRDDRSFFGYKAFIVLSDSMSATDFSAGDVVLTKEVDPATLEAGDIIAFRSENSDNYGQIVTHKIRELTENEQGEPGFVTYGTTTDTNDETIVTYDTVVGKYQGALPGVGRFFQFLKTTPGYILCVFLPFFLLIVIQAVNSVQLFRQYKREKSEEMQAEFDRQKEELAQERRALEEKMAQTEQMLAELKGLQQAQGAPAKPSGDAQVDQVLEELKAR